MTSIRYSILVLVFATLFSNISLALEEGTRTREWMIYIQNPEDLNFDDVIVGGSGNDTLQGHSANDAIVTGKTEPKPEDLLTPGEIEFLANDDAFHYKYPAPMAQPSSKVATPDYTKPFGYVAPKDKEFKFSNDPIGDILSDDISFTSGNWPNLTSQIKALPRGGDVHFVGGKICKSIPGILLEGIASWYGPGLYNRNPVACAGKGGIAANQKLHPNLAGVALQAGIARRLNIPCNAKVYIKNPKNGKEVITRFIDTGPLARGRVVDLTAPIRQMLGAYGNPKVLVKVCH